MTNCPTCGVELHDIPDDVGIDPSRFEVHASGKTIRLTPRQFELFAVLYHKLGITVSKKTLIARLYKLRPHRAPPNTKTLDVWISILRKKMHPFGFRIETRWGLGVTLLREPRMAVTTERAQHRKTQS